VERRYADHRLWAAYVKPAAPPHPLLNGRAAKTKLSEPLATRLFQMYATTRKSQ
jgi:hypothetical protein